MKKFVALILAMCVLISTTTVTFAARSVKLYINGQSIYVGDDHPRIVNDRTLVPIRIIAERFGALVSWDDATKTVTIKDDEIINRLTIGSDIVTKEYEGNVVEDKIDVSAMIINDRTYVPVRYIATSLGKIVDWDGVNYAVLINDNHSFEINGEAFDWQMTKPEFENIFGGAGYIFDSGRGFFWNVYNMNDDDMFMIGFKEGKICEILFASPHFYMNGHNMEDEMTSEQKAKYISNESFELFYDTLAGSKIAGVHISLQRVSNIQYSPNTSTSSIETAESQVIELVVNAMRAQYGASPLKSEKNASSAAKLHADDMSAQDYFNHISLDGKTPSNRYDSVVGRGGTWLRIAENIAINKDAISACYAWLNSASHRKAMLDNDYTVTGIGTDCEYRARRKNYYVQLFLKKAE